MRKIYTTVILFSTLQSFGQDFNDHPGNDDLAYLNLLFPAEKIEEINTVEKEDALRNNIQNLLDFAYSKLGTPYGGGGTGRGTYDCSGFTQSVFDRIGVSLPHASWAQATYGVEIPDSIIRPGDLLFFKGGNASSNRIGHVGVVCEVTPDGDVKMIHAATHGGVKIDSPFKTKYYQIRYMGARRILNP